MNKFRTKPISFSSDEEDDMDNDEQLKVDLRIEDNDKFFDHTHVELKESIQPNNIMDVFRRQPSNPNQTNPNQNNALERNRTTVVAESLKKDAATLNLPIVDNQSCQTTLSFEQDGKKNSTMNNDNYNNDDDDDDDLTLQGNFSLLIAKGMLKPSSF